jgi:hypothetical protein
MKQLVKHIFLFTTIIITALSCEKEITINLDGVESQIVIEAKVINKTGEEACSVLITKTTDYFSSTDPVYVEGAEVEISDSEGNSEKLTEVSDGQFVSKTLEGVPGREYYLTVKAEGQTYTAQSIMRPLVKIDSLTSRYNDIMSGAFDEEGYIVKCHYADSDDDSFIVLFSSKNGVPSEELFFSNGLFGSDIEEIYQIGDTAMVELRNVTEDIYHYYSTVNQISGSDDNPLNAGRVPTNPIGNISNNTLGYFGVFPISVESIIIKE